MWRVYSGNDAGRLKIYHFLLFPFLKYFSNYLWRWIADIIIVVIVLGRTKTTFLHTFENLATLVLVVVLAIFAALVLVVVVIIIEATVNGTVAIGGLKLEGSAIDVEAPIGRGHLTGNDLVILDLKKKQINIEKSLTTIFDSFLLLNSYGISVINERIILIVSSTQINVVVILVPFSTRRSISLSNKENNSIIKFVYQKNQYR